MGHQGQSSKADDMVLQYMYNVVLHKIVLI
jgi:hypothetical protein